MSKKRGLGKGLEALLSMEPPTPSGREVLNLDIDLIRRSPYQPRRDFDGEALQSLADSIKRYGVLQPIVVRKIESGGYELIAGERRWRATQLAGVERIPVVIRKESDNDAMCLALIENIQREDLNPLEEALAFERLIKEFSMTHEQLAKTFGRSRAAVTNSLRLLNLSDGVKELLQSGQISMGHARALLGAEVGEQLKLARKVLGCALSVRGTENLVRRQATADKGTAVSRVTMKSAKRVDANVLGLQEELSERLGTSVKIRSRSAEAGSLEIDYHSLDELQAILARIK